MLYKTENKHVFRVLKHQALLRIICNLIILILRKVRCFITETRVNFVSVLVDTHIYVYIYICINIYIKKLINLINWIFQHRAHLKGFFNKKFISRCKNVQDSSLTPLVGIKFYHKNMCGIYIYIYYFDYKI